MPAGVCDFGGASFNSTARFGCAARALLSGSGVGWLFFALATDGLSRDSSDGLRGHGAIGVWATLSGDSGVRSPALARKLLLRRGATLMRRCDEFSERGVGRSAASPPSSSNRLEDACSASRSSCLRECGIGVRDRSTCGGGVDVSLNVDMLPRRVW